MSGWVHLTKQQQDAVNAAARIVEDAGMRFVFLLFGDDGQVGALISNIEPADAVPMIDQALKAARADIGADDIIDGKGGLQ
jgi:hypothetical protein